MLLDATAGSPTANTYVTVDAATALLQGRLNTEPWFPASDDVEALALIGSRREAALVWATQLLDTQVQWYGLPLTSIQALAWPQTGQVDPYGRAVDSATIPEILQRATAFYALALLRDTSEDVETVADAGVLSKKFGDTTIVFRTQGMPLAPTRTIPAEVRALLRPYGTLTGSVMVPLVRT